MAKMGRPSYKVVLAGVDTLKVTAKGPLRAGVAEFLEVMQQEAKAERDQRRQRRQRNAVKLETMWEVAGQPLLIAPYGVRQGMYQWTMSCPAVTIDVGLGHFNGITAEARLSSSFLWEFGYRQAWEIVKSVLAEMGDFTYQVSTLHLCVDMSGVHVDKLRRRDFVGRGHVTRWYDENAVMVDVVERQRKAEERPMVEVVTRYLQQETLWFSPGAPMSGIVYDKIREIRFQSPEKAWFLDLWRKNGWDEDSPVGRVEMRLERAALHEMRVKLAEQEESADQGIETPEEAFDRLDAIWAYATQDWLRHTLPTQDKTRSRWPTSALWRAVQRAMFERQDADPGQRKKVRAFREQQMIGALLGYLESWGAWTAASDGDVQDISMVLRELAERSEDHYERKESDYVTETIQKRRKFGFAS